MTSNVANINKIAKKTKNDSTKESKTGHSEGI